MHLNVYPAAPAMPAQSLVFPNQTHYVVQGFFASQVPPAVVLDKMMRPIYVQLVTIALRVQQSQYLVFLEHTVQVED